MKKWMLILLSLVLLVTTATAETAAPAAGTIVVTTQIENADMAEFSLYQVRAAVTVEGRPEAADKINRRLEDIYYNAGTRIEELRNTPCEEGFSPSSYSLTIDSISTSGALLFITYSESWYASGAARPNSTEFALAFDTVTGGEVEIDAILPSDEAAMDALIAKVAEQMKSYEKDMFFTAEEAAEKARGGSSASWMIDGSDLCVIYPAGWLTPQFMGNITVRLPMSSLTGILDDAYLPMPTSGQGTAQLLPAAEGESAPWQLTATGDVADLTGCVYWGSEQSPYLHTVCYYASTLADATAALPRCAPEEWYVATYQLGGETVTLSSK